MSELEKPVLYLPTRALLIPCDYDPDKKQNVQYHRITLGYKLNRPVDLSRMWFRREIQEATS